MPKLLRSFPCTDSSEDFHIASIANTLSWLSGKGQNMYPLGIGKQFTDSSTARVSVSVPANAYLSDARLWTPWEHKSSNTFPNSLERLRILISGSAPTAVTAALALLSKASFQMKGLLGRLVHGELSPALLYKSLLCNLTSATLSPGTFKERHSARGKAGGLPGLPVVCVSLLPLCGRFPWKKLFLWQNAFLPLLACFRRCLSDQLETVNRVGKTRSSWYIWRVKHSQAAFLVNGMGSKRMLLSSYYWHK